MRGTFTSSVREATACSAEVPEMYCCDGFRNLIDNAGQRGMAALVHRTSDGFRFYFQSRAVSKADDLVLSKNPTPWAFPAQIDPNITLAATITLNYCPFCGTKLQSLIRRPTKGAFEELARRHSTIYEPPF